MFTQGDTGISLADFSTFTLHFKQNAMNFVANPLSCQSYDTQLTNRVGPIGSRKTS